MHRKEIGITQMMAGLMVISIIISTSFVHKHIHNDCQGVHCETCKKLERELKRVPLLDWVFVGIAAFMIGYWQLLGPKHYTVYRKNLVTPVTLKVKLLN